MARKSQRIQLSPSSVAPTFATPGMAASLDEATELPDPDGHASPHREETSPDVDETRFPVIGIGASAGGLEAFQAFFTNLSPDMGMAFVLVQHMDARHPSILPSLIQNYTTMPVLPVHENLRIAINTVHVIPPNHNLELRDGVLHLVDLPGIKARSGSIDHFFRSLAQDQQHHAVCVILSGTGTDGTLGLKAIKEAGGLVVVQDPDSDKYDGMPRSAIQTGLSDLILPPDQMPLALKNFFACKARHGHVLPTSRESPRWRVEADPKLLKTIFMLLRTQSGHDFSLYKENTILRRVERRMSIQQIVEIGLYVAYLKANPGEVKRLFQDLLIGVSNFFRDPDAFGVLAEKVIPKLFERRLESQPIRIWVPGCASGEEAYSIAMLLHEQMDRLGQTYPVQIFATDIDERAIETARSGRYPDTIANDLSTARLRRFFIQEGNHYRVKKSIRDMLIIAVQNVIKDPPFSNLDLISCRNLLIYMGPILQEKVHAIFHYALNPNGFLMLGTSETTSEAVAVHGILDRKWKIFQHKPQVNSMVKTLFVPSGANPRKPVIDKKSANRAAKQMLGLKELTEQHLLAHHAPTCLMVNDQYEVMYIHGKTGRYLEAVSGEANWNIMRLARDGLTIELASALRKVKTTQKRVSQEAIRIKSNGAGHVVNLIVEPILSPDTMKGWSWVIFEEAGPLSHVLENRPSGVISKKKKGSRLLELERELKSTREYLQTTIEELEVTNEELKSMNEELQAANEELQSANEELETAKEESQSVNEELITVNSEYEEKLNTVAKANNDMVNLMASTEIGTIFLDDAFKVVRFTPSATRFIHLIPGDVGRPIKHLVSNLKGCDLSASAQQVLDTLIPVEFESQTSEGQWLSIRVRPYRTVDNMIEGVVIAFIDITQIKIMQKSLLLSEERFKVALKSSPLGIMVANVDEQLRYTWVYNPHIFFKTEACMGKRDDEIADNPGMRQLLALKHKVLEEGQGDQERIDFPMGEGLMTCTVSAEPLLDLSGNRIGVTIALIDISELIKNKVLVIS
ncbi:MAG: PAS domain-containing protein [Magnetococcales bacterium]|nr:PAS domain-containing protein [Magnetococcales bacterium]